MRIKIKVHANSSKEEIKQRDNGLEVWIKQKPLEGKANEKLVKLLKKHYKKNIKIISGLRSRNKVIELN